MATRTYDLILLIDADAPTETRSKILSSTEETIKSTGELKARKDWGSRQLPYELDHHTEAEYHVWQFDADPEVLDRLNHSLRIMDGVLRFRIVHSIGNELPDAPPPLKRPADERSTYERPPRSARADGDINESDRRDKAAAPAPASSEKAEQPAEAEAEAAPAEVPAEAPAG